MCKGFDNQLILGSTPIHEVVIPTKTRSHMAALMAAVQYIYITPEWNQKVHSLLSKALNKGKKLTGREGMSLWELFVLGQVRLCMNTSYDELNHVANYDALLRGVLGVLPSDFSHGKIYEYQNIYDNVKLLDDELLKSINSVIVEVGHEVFKKKENTALRCVPIRLKTDSFVIETDTHFPTDYNLLWDSARKCIELCKQIADKHHMKGWRKAKDWKKHLKGLMRQLGKINSCGGKNKSVRLKQACRDYLSKARLLRKKVSNLLEGAPYQGMEDFTRLLEIQYYLDMLDKHIDLVDRRILQQQVIPHQEKVFSVFQPYTEWINKGKLHPSVEIGKKLFVTTDQYNLIVDYQLADHQADSELTIEIADRILNKYPAIQSFSVDKGFSNKEDKALLEAYIPEVIMPKKGRRNQQEKEAESRPAFKKLKNKHSAIESNINELEHRGLDRCPDRKQHNFKRYVGMAVSAYNLHKIGRWLLADQLEQQKAIEAKKPQWQRAA